MHVVSKVMFVAAMSWPLIACGGSSPPPEPPAVTAEPGPVEEPATPPAPREGEHTMPDGSTMPGEQHDHDHQK